VVIDNFRAGVMQRLRLAHADLAMVKPDVITCSISAFGEDGPYRDLPAFDLIIQAMGGGLSITGQPGNDPVRAGIPIGDLAGGLFGALAVCAALVHRARTGLGQHIDLALLDAQVSLLTYVAQYHLVDGRVPGPSGTTHQSSVPYQAFRTSDGYVVVCVLVDRFWPPLCRVVGLPELTEQYPTNALRVAARQTLVPILEERFRHRTTSEWIGELRTAGVPVGPVNSIDLVVNDPQVLHRNMVVNDGGTRILGNPIKTGGTDTFLPAPKLGEHSAELLPFRNEHAT
jgi:crotonobetainyl-CoA:carnitine CoA-transferase CaiB-like acyl-CoA transferase